MTKKEMILNYLNIEGNAEKQTKDQLKELAEIGCDIERTVFLKYKRQLKVTVGHTEVTPQKVTVGHTEVTPQKVTVGHTLLSVFRFLVEKKVGAQVYMGLFQPLMQELNEVNDTDQMDEVIDLLLELEKDKYYQRCSFDFEQSFWRIYEINKKYFNNLNKYWK